MVDSTDLDLHEAHKFFSTSCFNRAWDLIEKSNRTSSDDEQMLHLAYTSLWHWMQRTDCSDSNLSIGYWQLSRIHALLGDADKARKSADLCLKKTPPTHRSSSVTPTRPWHGLSRDLSS